MDLGLGGYLGKGPISDISFQISELVALSCLGNSMSTMQWSGIIQKTFIVSLHMCLCVHACVPACIRGVHVCGYETGRPIGRHQLVPWKFRMKNPPVEKSE